jgi:hypothetical protein
LTTAFESLIAGIACTSASILSAYPDSFPRSGPVRLNWIGYAAVSPPPMGDRITIVGL